MVSCSGTVITAVTPTGTGNALQWGLGETWLGGVVPTAGDDVVIAWSQSDWCDGNAMAYLDVTGLAECRSLLVERPAGGCAGSIVVTGELRVTTSVTLTNSFLFLNSSTVSAGSVEAVASNMGGSGTILAPVTASGGTAIAPGANMMLQCLLCWTGSPATDKLGDLELQSLNVTSTGASIFSSLASPITASFPGRLNTTRSCSSVMAHLLIVDANSVLSLVSQFPFPPVSELLFLLFYLLIRSLVRMVHFSLGTRYR